MHQAQSRARAFNYLPEGGREEPTSINERCLSDRILGDSMPAALIGHPGAYYTTIRGGEVGNEYTAQAVVSPPNINRAFTTFGIGNLAGAIGYLMSCDPNAMYGLDFDNTNLDYELISFNLHSYNSYNFYSYRQGYKDVMLSDYRYNSLGYLQHAIDSETSGELDSIKATCVDGRPQYVFIKRENEEKVLPKSYLYYPIIVNPSRFEELEAQSLTNGYLTIDARATSRKTGTYTRGLDPYSNIEQKAIDRGFAAKLPLADDAFYYPIEKVEINVMLSPYVLPELVVNLAKINPDLYNLYMSTLTTLTSVEIPDAYYAVDGGNLYLTDTVENILKAEVANYDGLVQGAEYKSFYYGVEVSFKRIVSSYYSENKDDQMMALTQATSYSVMDYFNQWSFAFTTSQMIDEIGYTALTTAISTTISTAVIALGSWAVAGARGAFSQAGGITAKEAVKVLFKQLTWDVLKSVVRETFEEIVIDGLIETLAENLVDIAGGNEEIAFWTSTILTSIRETDHGPGRGKQKFDFASAMVFSKDFRAMFAEYRSRNSHMSDTELRESFTGMMEEKTNVEQELREQELQDKSAWKRFLASRTFSGIGAVAKGVGVLTGGINLVTAYSTLKGLTSNVLHAPKTISKIYASVQAGRQQKKLQKGINEQVPVEIGQNVVLKKSPVQSIIGFFRKLTGFKSMPTNPTLPTITNPSKSNEKISRSVEEINNALDVIAQKSSNLEGVESIKNHPSIAETAQKSGSNRIKIEKGEGMEQIPGILHTGEYSTFTFSDEVPGDLSLTEAISLLYRELDLPKDIFGLLMHAKIDGTTIKDGAVINGQTIRESMSIDEINEIAGGIEMVFLPVIAGGTDEGYNHIKKYFEYNIFKGQIETFFPTNKDKEVLEIFYHEILVPYRDQFLAEFGFSKKGADPENYDDINVDRVKKVFDALLETDFIENSEIQDLIKGNPSAWEKSIRNYFKLFFEVSFSGKDNIEALRETFVGMVEFTIMDMITREYIGIDQLGYADKAHLTGERLGNFINDLLGIKSYFKKEFFGPRGLVRFFEEFMASRFLSATSKKFTTAEKSAQTFIGKYLEADICYSELPLILAQIFKDSGSKEFSFFDAANLNPHGILHNFNQFILGESVENRRLVSIYEYMFNGINFYANNKYSMVRSYSEKDVGIFGNKEVSIQIEAKNTWDKNLKKYSTRVEKMVRQVSSSQYLKFLEALNYRIEHGSKDLDRSSLKNYLFSPHFKKYEGKDDAIELCLLDVIDDLSNIKEVTDLEGGFPKPNILIESIAQMINLEVKEMSFAPSDDVNKKVQEKIEELFADDSTDGFEVKVKKLYKEILAGKISDAEIDVLYGEIRNDFIQNIGKYIRESPNFADSEYEIVFDNSIRIHYDSGQPLTRDMLPVDCFIVEKSVKRDLGPGDSIPRKALKIVHDKDGKFGVMVDDTINDLPSDVYEGYKDREGFVHHNLYVQSDQGNYLISDLNLETMEIREDDWQKIAFILDESGNIRKPDGVRYFLAFSRNTGSRHTSDIREVVTHIRPMEFFKEYAPGLTAIQSPSDVSGDVIISVKSKYDVDGEYRRMFGILENYLTQLTVYSDLRLSAFPGAYESFFDEELYQIFSEEKKDQDGKTIVYNNKYFESVFQQLGFSGNFYEMTKKEFYSGILNGLKASPATEYIQYVREQSEISTSLTEDVFKDDSKSFYRVDGALLTKLKKAMTIMFGFAGIYMLKTGQLVIDSDYKASNPILNHEQMLEIYEHQKITDLSYKRTRRGYYGENSISKTFYISKGGSYRGRFYTFLGAWTTGIREVIPLLDSRDPYSLEFLPDTDVISNINEGDLKLDLAKLTQRQKKQIVTGILDRGLVKYLSLTTEEIMKRTKEENKEIFFESCNLAVKELYKLIPDQGLKGFIKEDIIEQIANDVVQIRIQWGKRKMEDGSYKTTTDTVRYSLEKAKKSWNNPKEKDKMEVVVYLKSEDYWTPVPLLINDPNDFADIRHIGQKLSKRWNYEQKHIDEYIIEKIEDFYEDYKDNKKGLSFTNWLLKEEQFYLFYAYIGDFRLGLSYDDFYSEPS